VAYSLAKGAFRTVEAVINDSLLPCGYKKQLLYATVVLSKPTVKCPSVSSRLTSPTFIAGSSRREQSSHALFAGGPRAVLSSVLCNERTAEPDLVSQRTCSTAEITDLLIRYDERSL
jgi:hypothetical protein